MFYFVCSPFVSFPWFCHEFLCEAAVAVENNADVFWDVTNGWFHVLFFSEIGSFCAFLDLFKCYGCGGNLYMFLPVPGCMHFLSRRDARKWLDDEGIVIDLDKFSLVEDRNKMFVVCSDLRKVDFFDELRVVRVGYKLC